MSRERATSGGVTSADVALMLLIQKSECRLSFPGSSQIP